MVFIHSGLRGNQLHNPKGLQYAEDVLNFNVHSWKNSGLIWNESLTKWTAKPSGGSTGVSNLSALTIDANKDWNAKGIYDLTYLSSQTISGGIIRTQSLDLLGNTISGIAVPIWPSAAANKHYVDYRTPIKDPIIPEKLAGAIWCSGTNEKCAFYVCTGNNLPWRKIQLI